MRNAFSSGAISAKIRAMYGRRITTEQYLNLMNKHSIPEAAAFLKDETSYGETLQGIQPTTVHRGQLENLLKKRRFERYSALTLYTQNTSYYSYIVREAEIEQILQMLRLLNSDRPEDYIIQYPIFIDKFADFSFVELAKSRNFDDLLECLDKTSYAGILAKLRPPSGGFIDYTLCEAMLHAHFFISHRETINKSFGKKTRAQLNQLFDTYIEISNINNILRIKSFFPSTGAERIRKCMLPVNNRIPKSMWETLYTAENSEAVLNILQSSPYADYKGEDDSVFAKYRTDKICSPICRRMLRSSTSTEAVFSAYMILSLVELSNITVIIEGIRYGLEAKEIEKMIIFES